MPAENYDTTQLEDDVFSPEAHLINIVKRAVKNSQDIHVSIPGQGSIVVMSSIGEYLDNSDDLERFCKFDADVYKVTILAKQDVVADMEKNGRNIDELMWKIGFYLSEGRLMEGCYRDDVVELMHWPNFTRVPSTSNAMRLASLLSSHPTSITLAHRFLKIDRAEAYQFYTAARCAGLARAVNRVPEEPPLKPHRNQALLGMLLHKIAGI